jgi:Sensors of blue-light using FAD
MSAFRSIVYCSEMTQVFDERMLEQLLSSARAFNVKVSVTGVLLHRDGQFFQYFEGSPDGVAEVYRRIQANPDHRSIIKLHDGDIESREFPQWDMALVKPVASDLLKLSQASWKVTRSALDQSVRARSDGVLLLNGFRRGKRDGL